MARYSKCRNKHGQHQEIGLSIATVWKSKVTVASSSIRISFGMGTITVVSFRRRTCQKACEGGDGGVVEGHSGWQLRAEALAKAVSQLHRACINVKQDNLGKDNSIRR